jgi:hypothetical protein
MGKQTMNTMKEFPGATWSRLQVGLIMVLFTVSVNWADQRSYVWTYEYSTLEAGEAEFEQYYTISSPNRGSLQGTTTTELNLEFEVGMTDRFDFGLYQVFEQLPENSLRYVGYKLRFRYRFAEQGRYFLDPLFYLEYKGKPDFFRHAIEGKIILAKTMGNWNVALNPAWEFAKEGDEQELEWEYTAGVNYRIAPLLRLGLETFGNANRQYWGPVIAHGVGDLWVSLGSGFAVTTVPNDQPEFMMRLLIGVRVR